MALDAQYYISPTTLNETAEQRYKFEFIPHKILLMRGHTIFQGVPLDSNWYVPALMTLSDSSSLLINPPHYQANQHL